MVNKIEKIDYNILSEYKKSYRPYNNYNADYQTDAPSYYDYLGNLNNIFTSIIDTINKQVDYVNALDNKDIKVEDTETIKLMMEGDFKVDPQILLKGRLKISDYTETITLNNKNFDINNAIVSKEDGIYIKDYKEVINYLNLLIQENVKIINEHNTQIKNNLDKITTLKTDTQTNIDTINENVNSVETSMQTYKAITDSLSKVYNSLSEQTAQNMTDISTNTNGLAKLKTQVTTGFSSLNTFQKNTNALFDNILERLDTLEAK